MTRSVEAHINPNVLAWARKSAGLSLQEAAARLKQSPDILQQWEVGERRPSVSKLRELSRIYNRSLATFYLSAPPGDYRPLRDFRRLPSIESPRISPRLVQENRRAHERRELALDLLEQLDEEIPQFTFSVELSQDSERIAPAIRKFLGVSLSKQKQLRDQHKALNFWRKALENVGILVFHAPGIDLLEMRGFSISETPLPVVVLNSKDSPRGRIFTLIHELAHILLRSGGICNLEELNNRPEERRIEKFCNSVSGATLVPKDDFLQNELLDRRGKRKMWPEEISELASAYSVSREVILRRLLEFRLITKDYFNKTTQEYQEEYNKPKGKDNVKIPYPIRVLSREGFFYTSLVLRGYSEAVITSSELADYLKIKLNRLADLERRLWTRAS